MKDDRVYLLHVVDCIERIRKYTRDGQGAFIADTLIQDAVLRNLEVIGEAVKNLPEEIRELNPQIEWRKIAGIRDILIHQYFSVDLEIIWDIVENKIPDLETGVQKIIQT